MFRRFHEKLQEKEGGFTLIELLVVILIIAILAAIAIPVFLSQRAKGWTAQSESALKNLATSIESYATGNNGSYLVQPGGTVPTLADLEGEGFNAVTGVTVTIDATADTYCLDANHDQTIPDMMYTSATGVPEEGTCP